MTTYKIRCTNCETEFWDDDALVLMEDPKVDELIHGCPFCKTDAYLMDLDISEKEQNHE